MCEKKGDFLTKLNEISQRMCGVDYVNLEPYGLSRISCLLEATNVITADEHERFKEFLGG